jgi:long-chain-fatty-acid--CoA ligase ACSBG
MHHFTLPSLGDSEYLYISPEGLNKLATVYDPKDPVKNINWTVDYTLELPIRMKKFGPGRSAILEYFF